MNIHRGTWATARLGLAMALVLVFASGLSYPGGTVRDESTRGYSFTHNFLSDLGTTVAFNDQRNVTGAVLFVASVFIGVLVLASVIAATVRLLSAAPRARSFARLAALAGVLACVGFLVTAMAPLDRASRLHSLAGMVGFRAFPVVTALLAIATARDARFRARAAVGWAAVTIVVIGLIVASLLGPSTDTDRGLATQVIMQKIMVAAMVAVLWFETREAENSLRSKSATMLGMGLGVCCALTATAPRASAQLGQREPTPEPAIPAIIALFGTYEVVGMGAAHGMKDLDDFILTLVRTPGFADVVNDVVVECGNSRYQSVLDRYIAGENVSLVQVQRVWRETTGPHMCSVSSFYSQLFPLIRRINQGVPSAKALRVLAADPPIDWSAIRDSADYNRFFVTRDSNIAAVMEREVLSKHRKALMLFGAAHLAHGLTPAVAATARQQPGGFGVASAVGRYEERYPGLTFTIELYGCGAGTRWGAALESWRVPSLLRTRGTRLATPSNAPFPGIGPDGILYLGPPELLLYELRPAFPFLEDSLILELRHRSTVMPANPVRDAYIDRHATDADTNPFLCSPKR